MMQKFSILTSKDELVLEPCMNLLFKSLYYYNCENYSKVTYSSTSRNVEDRKGVNEKYYFSINEINNTVSLCA